MYLFCFHTLAVLFFQVYISNTESLTYIIYTQSNPLHLVSLFFSVICFERFTELRCFQGFVSAVSHMRSFVPAIYDVTVAIPKSSPPPTMLRLFTGQSSVVSFFFFNKKTASSVFSFFLATYYTK